MQQHVIVTEHPAHMAPLVVELRQAEVRKLVPLWQRRQWQGHRTRIGACDKFAQGWRVGVLAALLVWVNVLGTLSTLGFATSVLRFLPQYLTEASLPRARGFHRTGLLIAIVTGTAIAALGLFLLSRFTTLLPPSYAGPARMALLAIPAYVTGEPAEEIAEKLPGVSEQVIDPHEDAAKLALGATLAVGAVALAGLVAFRARALPLAFSLGLLALAVVAAGTLGWTANLGGRIRHPEIRGIDGSGR